MATPMPWNLVAPAYTDEIVPLFEAYARDALALAAVPAGARILDVACGPGTLAVLAAQAGARVDAIDFSPAMIEHLEARVKTLGLSNLAARVGDGQALPYEPGTFAAAFSMFGLMFFPDRAKGFAELRRVLAPGGRAVISTWTRLEDTPALHAMFDALRAEMAKHLAPGAPKAGEQELPLTTEDACRAEMGAAFRDVEVRRVPHVQRYDSAAELWEALQRTMAPIALMKKMMGERWPAVAEVAGAAIGDVLGGGAVEITMTALVTTGVA
jgi:SAM-dependent methyltransferase